jgi:ATP-binding cassette subfamily C protein
MGLLTVVYLALAVRLSPGLAALASGCAAVLLLVLSTRNRTASETGGAFLKASNSLYTAVAEHLGGMKEAKSYGAEPRHVALFADITKAHRGLVLRFVRQSADTKMCFDIGAVVVVSLLVYSAVAIIQVPLATLLLLLLLCARLLPQCAAMQQSYQQVLHMLPAFAAVMAMQARCTVAAEPPQGRTGKAVQVQCGIQFQQVCFRYDAAAHTATIQGLSCSIPARRTTAIVGPSGAGKSTMADLLMGLLVPDQGAILVDGVSLHSSWLGAWRQAIGYVPQDPFLLHDTVRANLLWAWPEASEAEMYRALQHAAAAELVAALPQGLDTILGDRGVRLSGGERQRLALARALLRRPSLLLLDEATSALDTANEQRIHHALAHLRGELTIVMIAHRLSTVRAADHILVVEAGRVVEAGTWDDLWARPDGRFRAMVQADRRQAPGPLQDEPSGTVQDAPLLRDDA